jgi:hypothetical protein
MRQSRRKREKQAIGGQHEYFGLRETRISNNYR